MCVLWVAVCVSGSGYSLLARVHYAQRRLRCMCGDCFCCFVVFVLLLFLRRAALFLILLLTHFGATTARKHTYKRIQFYFKPQNLNTFIFHIFANLPRLDHISSWNYMT